MKRQKVLKLTARILAITYILFLSLFALDVFQADAAWYQLFGGFLLHLIPSFVMLIVLAIAWKWPQFGGAFFIVLYLLAFIIFKNSFWGNVILFWPLLLVGFLFLAQDSSPNKQPDSL